MAKHDWSFDPPSNWPKWNLKCQAHSRTGKAECRNWAVRGMPTCRLHGSGGERNKQLGQLRYLCWVITGGPQNMPVALACRVALYVFAEAVLNNGKGTPEQQIIAATFITKTLDSG